MEKTTSADSVPVFIGMDYHTKSIQVCVLDPSGKVLRNKPCGNSLSEISRLIEPHWRVQRAAVESCCGSADLAEAIAAEFRWSISLAHPGYVNRMKHNPDKTDYGDARMLAELARVGMIPPVWLPPTVIRELRLLVRLRADAVGRVKAIKMRTLAVLRLQRIPEPDSKEIGGRWSQRWLRWLDAQAVSEQGRFVIQMHLQEYAQLKERLGCIEARLAAATKNDPIVKKLMGIKGVGKVTAWVMRAVIGRFDRFTTGKQLARFCGVTPLNASSGERTADAGLIKSGDRLLKSVLVEAAHRLKRQHARWRKLSEEMLKRGKNKNVVTAAIANRWIRGLHHQMKEEPAMGM